MTKKGSKKSAPAKKKQKTPDEKAAAERFVKDVLTRGEAAKPDEHGKLPSGATHEIVEECEGELPKIKRKRFSMV
jgi:hypothetical protein